MPQVDHALFRAIFEHASAAMAIADMEGRFTHCNRAFCAMSGYTREEVAGRSIADLIDPDAVPCIESGLARSDGDDAVRRECQFRRKDGSAFVAGVSSRRFPSRRNPAVLLEITEKTEAAAPLHRAGQNRNWPAHASGHPQSIQRFELALKSFPITVVCQDLDLRHTWAYNSCFPQSDLLGKTDSEIFGRASASEELKREVIRTGVSRRQEIAIQAGGKDRFYDMLADPMRDSAGTITGVMCAVIDITDRKQADAILQTRKDRKAFLLSLSDTLRGISDPFELTAKACEMLGRKLGVEQAACIGIDETGEHADVCSAWNDGAFPDVAASRGEGALEVFMTELKLGAATAVSDVRADLRTSTPEALAAFESIQAGAFIYVPLLKAGRLAGALAVVAREARSWNENEFSLTQGAAERTWEAFERARAEQALRESEERLRFSLSGAGAAAWQWDFVAQKQIWSRESYQLHGRDQKLGPPSYQDWLHCLHPGDRGRIEKIISEEVERRSPEYRTEYRVVHPSGEIRWLDALGRIDYAADGSPVRLSGINLDITERKRAEEALRQAEDLQRQKCEELETILAAIPIPVFIAEDAACARMTGNRAAYDLLRLPRDVSLSMTAPPEQMPKNFEVFSEGRRLSPHELPIQQAAATRNAITLAEHEIRFIEGDSKFVLINALPLFGNTGEARGAVGAFIDVTALKRTEAALREGEESLRFALEAARAGTWEMDLATGKLTASDQTLAFLGIPPGTPATHETALACAHPDDRPRIEESLRRTVETGEPIRLEWRVTLPDETVRWLESRAEQRLKSGRRVVAGLVLDITERKRSVMELREGKALLRSIVEHVPAPILLTREDLKILSINPALTALTGYSASDIPTRDEWEAYAYRENASCARRVLLGAFESGTPLNHGEIWIWTKSGERQLWSLRTAPAGRDASGKRLLVSVGLDVTEHRRSAEEARESKSKLEAALASMMDAVFISDAVGRFIHFNEALATFHKFKSKEECAKTLAEYPALLDVFLPSGEPAPLEQWAVPRALRGETAAQEYTLRRKDTGETWVGSYNFAPIRNADGDIIGSVVTARDITDQKRAERRLRASEARLSSIIDTAADSIIIVDESGTIQSANRATMGIFGYSPENLRGKNVSFLMPPRAKCEHDRFLAEFCGADSVKEVEALRMNGSTIPLDVAVAEWRDGEGRRFFTAILRDLSERKRNEEILANARRLEAVAQLAGGAAHDFNNLLAVIAGNLELAEDAIADEAARQLIRRALDAAEKGSSLNRRLLSLARKGALKPQRICLNGRVEETAKLLTSTLGEHITVSAGLEASLWTTLADPGEIDSAILNIAANARDAMPNGGRIVIETSNVALDAAAAQKLHPSAREGEYVRLTIADNGAGMTPVVLRKAMDPFFTTKGPGAGTGLGLTSVASFAKQSGGFATIVSAPAEGCTVSLYLPRSYEQAPGGAFPASEIPMGDGELVLVVEDDDQVREVTLKRIESLGYAVTEARTGPEAVWRLQLPEPIQLVLSDVVMPGGMTGYDLARWVASNRPGLKVVMCSGYNEGDRGANAQEPALDVIMLGKPYGRDELARALRDALA
jgi:PAS domain S-box-containing protein